MIDRTNHSGSPDFSDDATDAPRPLTFRTPEQDRAIRAASEVNGAIEALRRAKDTTSAMPDLTSAILSRVEQSRPFIDAPARRRHRIVKAACVGLTLGGVGCIGYIVVVRPWHVPTPGAIGSVVRGASEDAQSGFASVRRLSSAWATTGVDPLAGPLPSLDVPAVTPITRTSPMVSALTRQVIGPRDADPTQGVSLSNVLPLSSFFGRETTSPNPSVSLSSATMLSDSSLQRSLGLQAQSFSARVREAIKPLSPSSGPIPLAEDSSDAFFTPR